MKFESKLLVNATIAFYLLVSPLIAMMEDESRSCFLVKSGEQFLVREGKEQERHPPCCMCNMAFSLMGFNEGVLTHEEEPVWPYKMSYKATREILMQPHNPTSWMKNSSLWFTQVLVEKMGIETVQRYLSLLNYGNMDLSGYKSVNEGLPPPFWASSSLMISPVEQLDFLEKLVESCLPFPERVQRLTRNILYIEELSPGWKLYGKTGAGTIPKNDASRDREYKYGWFAGWLQKDNETFTFVRYLEDNQPGADYPHTKAKKQVEEKLRELIGNL